MRKFLAKLSISVFLGILGVPYGRGGVKIWRNSAEIIRNYFPTNSNNLPQADFKTQKLESNFSENINFPILILRD